MVIFFFFPLSLLKNITFWLSSSIGRTHPELPVVSAVIHQSAPSRRSPQPWHRPSLFRRLWPPSEGGAVTWGLRPRVGGRKGGIILHEVAWTISQRQLSESPVCQASESCVLIRERRLCRQARSFQKKKKGKKMTLRHIPLLGGYHSILLMVTWERRSCCEKASRVFLWWFNVLLS